MIIRYKPIIGMSAVSTRHYNIDEITLSGMVFTALKLIGSDRVIFERDTKEIIDLDEVSKMDFSSLYQKKEFLMGIQEMALMLGINPNILITDLNYKFLKIDLSNTSSYVNGNIIDIDEIQFPYKDNINLLLNKCFPTAKGLGMMLPCTIYMYLEDKIIGVTMATRFMPSYINYITGYYIFNVCTDPQYQGQGIGKSLLICTINDLILLGVKSFTLEVDITNRRAYKLYTTLGFIKINSTIHDDKLHDVLHLNIQNT